MPDHPLLDYTALMSRLSGYKAPHRKITGLLKAGELIRIKKENPVSTEHVANLIYGPSYVSQEFALGFYGLIPEHVEMATSMTTGRNKQFRTPLGTFRYTHLDPKQYTVGIDWLLLYNNIRIFIASPEKAIADTLIQHSDITTVKDMREHLIENMRIDSDDLNALNQQRLAKISDAYHHPTVTLFRKTISQS